MPCSKSCFIIALALLDKLQLEHPEFTLTHRNKFKLFLTALVLATKQNDDEIYVNSFYASCGGI